MSPTVPCRRIATWCGSRYLSEITGKRFRPQLHLLLLGSLASLRSWRHLATKVGTSKS